MTNNELPNFNIEPTRQGYARMAELFRDSIKRHQFDRKEIEIMSEFDWALATYNHNLLSENEGELITSALDMLYADKGKAIAELERSLADIEAYLAMEERTAHEAQ